MTRGKAPAPALPMTERQRRLLEQEVGKRTTLRSYFNSTSKQRRTKHQQNCPGIGYCQEHGQVMAKTNAILNLKVPILMGIGWGRIGWRAS